nr:SWEET sugar transporter [Tanacetum cinerariifolium]
WLLHRNVVHLFLSLLRNKEGQDGKFKANCTANSCRIWIDCCPNSVPCNWSYPWCDSRMDLPCVLFMCFCSTFGSFVALTLSAVMWFFYGLLLGDYNIAV